MPLIFLGLACLNAVALFVTFSLGFFTEAGPALGPNTSLNHAHDVHFLAGLITAVFTLLVHSLAFTYFLGTGRWVQEVVGAYRLPGSMFERSRSLKSRTFPFILGSMLLVIAATTSGAACDRDMLRPTFHLALAVLTVAFNLWSYLFEFRTIRANRNLLEQIMEDVKRMRQERGLE